MNRRQHKTISDALAWSAVLVLVVLTLLAGKADHEEAERQQEECQEMLALWDKTGGRQGWPDCGEY